MNEPAATENFCLSTREEVVRFEELFAAYQKERGWFAMGSLSLATAWDRLQCRDDAPRLFSALLDLWLTFILLHLDATSISGTWNTLFSKGKLEGGSALDSPERFFGKMDIHRFSTSYVLRYRAFWDKTMGFLILLLAPEKYDKFYGAPGRKKFFKEVFASEQEHPLVIIIDKYVTEFDDKFRTPEAHGSGVLRKWTLSMQSGTENPQVRLLGFLNLATLTIAALGDYFRKQAEQLPSP
jgi:hypothetical protein